MGSKRFTISETLSGGVNSDIPLIVASALLTLKFFPTSFYLFVDSLSLVHYIVLYEGGTKFCDLYIRICSIIAMFYYARVIL
jgi:hypothetical protein